MLGPADVLALDQYQEQVPLGSLPQQSEAAATPAGKRGRKRKVPLEATIEDSSAVLRDAQQPNASLPTDEVPVHDNTSFQPDSLHTTAGEMPLPYTAEAVEPNAPTTIGYSGMTPVGMHGDYDPSMTPHHHGIDQLESIPNLPADQVSSILNGTGMENYGFDDSHHNDGGMSERVDNDWNDYDFPQSVGQHVSIHIYI